jgi:hypothetical protein
MALVRARLRHGASGLHLSCSRQYQRSSVGIQQAVRAGGRGLAGSTPREPAPQRSPMRTRVRARAADDAVAKDRHALGADFFGERFHSIGLSRWRALPAARWESLVEARFHGSHRGWWIEKTTIVSRYDAPRQRAPRPCQTRSKSSPRRPRENGGSSPRALRGLSQREGRWTRGGVVDQGASLRFRATKVLGVWRLGSRGGSRSARSPPRARAMALDPEQRVKADRRGAVESSLRDAASNGHDRAARLHLYRRNPRR